MMTKRNKVIKNKPEVVKDSKENKESKDSKKSKEDVKFRQKHSEKIEFMRRVASGTVR